uniref:DDB1- and CUL4-associated factor 13 n=1 Tax=Cajanus cajan TaxID=3821 RepID=A0A151RD23_CAJCA|nr:WD repeat and SOF domain-containing protein 1 [Cajanus cajan]
MKVKVISRSVDEFTRERSQDLQVIQSTRPFITCVLLIAQFNQIYKLLLFLTLPLSFGKEGVQELRSQPSSSREGGGVYIRLWDLAARRTVCQFPGHQGAVRGLTASTDGRILVSCGTDCTIRLWNIPPASVHVWKNAFWGVDHQWDGEHFATAGAQVDIWNHNRSQPINSFEWGSDTVISVRFNPGEPNLLATSASDRSIILYDLRMASPVRKMIMMTKTNSISWNPMEPINFTAANEDGNCYSYDARKLDEAKCVHKDHVSAVMDIDYSPTGREFVTGSYDRTVRLFQFNGGHSKEIYHTKRMQRVFCVKFSGDGSYVISGSDDTNLRLWKAKASEQLGVILPRERKKHEYHEAIKKRYKHLPEISRIAKHRHLPRPIYKASKLMHVMADAKRRKEEKRKAHSAPGSIKTQPLRRRRIIKEVE